MLDQVIPFRYLTREEREALRADMTERSYEAGEVLIHQGDAEDKRVFLLESGSVVALDRTWDPPKQLRRITAGHYFGERAALFEEARSAEIRALEPVRVACIPGERVVELLQESSAFAQALGKILRDKQGIFTPFDRFRTELPRAVGEGSVDLSRLLPHYRRLEPALHPLAASRDELDPGALTYAVRRLPENVTRTLAFYLTETLPFLYADPDRRFTSVPADARRRAVYEMIPGKNMVPSGTASPTSSTWSRASACTPSRRARSGAPSATRAVWSRSRRRTSPPCGASGPRTRASACVSSRYTTRTSVSRSTRS